MPALRSRRMAPPRASRFVYTRRRRRRAQFSTPFARSVRSWSWWTDTSAMPGENPTTHAAGLRVPGPLGDRLILDAVRESHGDAVSVSEDQIRSATAQIGRETGIDAAPEGGAALAVLSIMVHDGRIPADAEVVVFNTGIGSSYRT